MNQLLSDKDWRSRDDARILTEAEKIRADKARMRNAALAAKKMQIEKQKELTALKKISKKKK